MVSETASDPGIGGPYFVVVGLFLFFYGGDSFRHGNARGPIRFGRPAPCLYVLWLLFFAGLQLLPFRLFGFRNIRLLTRAFRFPFYVHFKDNILSNQDAAGQSTNDVHDVVSRQRGEQLQFRLGFAACQRLQAFRRSAHHGPCLAQFRNELGRSEHDSPFCKGQVYRCS